MQLIEENYFLKKSFVDKLQENLEKLNRAKNNIQENYFKIDRLPLD